MAVEGIQVAAITGTVRIIMAVGTAGGDTGTIPVVIGGDLGFILIPVGGGPMHTPIHIPTIPIHHIPTLIMFLHRRSLSSLLRIANRSNNNLTTGTTARTRRATTHTSKVVREAGCR